MRYLVVGLGNVGSKRLRILGERCAATADPYVLGATHRRYVDVPLELFDAAILAVPNEIKVECLEYFLQSRKHVLIEKPLILSDEDLSRALERMARDHEAIWYTSYTLRFEPHVVQLQKLLADGAVGEVYRARLVYGNGTVQNWRDTWRENGWGVLEDLGCHLIDLCELLFPGSAGQYLLWDLRRLESRTFDYGVAATADRKVMLQFGTIIWHNTFTIDVYGSAGSLHMRGLAKWGETELVMSQRVYPSGPPIEAREISCEPDRSWEADLAEFEHRVARGEISRETDWRVSRAIHTLGRQASSVGVLPLQAASRE